MHLYKFYVGPVFRKTTKQTVVSYVKIPAFGPNIGKDIMNDACGAFLAQTATSNSSNHWDRM